MPHTCHASKCETRVPRRMFMCRKHWFMLPKEMQDEVWATYTPGQEEGNFHLIIPEYFAATRKAINYIRELEAV